MYNVLCYCTLYNVLCTCRGKAICRNTYCKYVAIP